MKKLRVTVNGISYDVEVEVLEDDDDAAGGSYGYTFTAPQAATSLASGPAPMAAPSPAVSGAPPAAGEKVVTSPIAGMIKKVNVNVGDTVKENDALVIIEAMKMDTTISSPTAGKIKEIRVKPEDPVQQGQILLTFA